MMTIDGSWGDHAPGGFCDVADARPDVHVPHALARDAQRLGTMTGHMIAVQHIADESSNLTDVVTCSAFPHAQPITCGLPCLTGGVRTWVSERLDGLLKV